MTHSRFMIRKGPSKERLGRFIAVDNLTSQMPLIELIQSRRKDYVRLWVAYDPERVCGTYIDIHQNGAVYTKTVYPGGHTETKKNRKADWR
jgi:hypothetical protein